MTALIVVNRVPLAVDAVLTDDDDRVTLRGLFEVAARGGAEACALVAEAWQYGGTEKKLQRAIRHAKEGHSLAELPGRREMLFVHAISPHGEVLRAFRITKRGALRPMPPDSPILSRFLTDLPWQPLPRKDAR
jgi:hypothetical protein